MSSEAATLLASFIIVTAIIVVLSRLAKGRIEAKEEELRKSVALRGWTFGKKNERGYRIYTFSGTTDGVAWEAESAKLVAGGSKGQRRRHIARWHGKWSPGVSAPIVGMGVPKGKEVMTHKIAQGDGFFARMAQKAAGYALDMGIDIYFGKEIGAEIDAQTLKHVEAPSVPGYIFMAGNPDEAKRILAEGLQRSLLDATSDKNNVLSEEDRPYLLLRPHSISLARMEQIRDVGELEQFVKAGVGLTRAFRFGRPIS
jgi:hypothetical protein